MQSELYDVEVFTVICLGSLTTSLTLEHQQTMSYADPKSLEITTI